MDIKADSHGENIQGVSSSPCHLKVGLQNVDGSRKGFMTAATEQGNARIQQDGGDQRSIGNTSQAFDTALKAPYRKATEEKAKIIHLSEKIFL